MQVALKKWGNSLAFRVPKDILKSLNIDENSTFELSIHNGKLIAEPTNNLKLEELVSQINDANLHTEIDSGKAVGNEEW